MIRALLNPLHLADHAEFAAKASSQEAVRWSRAESPKHILVADDDPLVRGSLAAVLELEGYVVEEACDGREAVRQATANTPDLILLDINMPDWDGWTAFTQVDRVLPHVPVIVITARPNQYEKAVKLGVNAFMEKPLNFDILLSAIRHFTAKRSDGRLRRMKDPGCVPMLLSCFRRGHEEDDSAHS